MALTKIRYKGLSDERIMTRKELGDAGYTVDKGLHFHRGNHWAQVMDSPTDEFLDMLKRDGNFTVEDAEAGEGAAAIMTADPSKADDTGKTVIDKNEAKGVENKNAGKSA